MYGLWLNIGFLKPKDVTSAAHLENHVTMDKLYEILGIKAFRGDLVSIDTNSILVAILEATVMKFDNQALVIGKDRKGNMRYTLVKVENGILQTTPLDISKDNVLTSQGTTLKVKVNDKQENVIISLGSDVLRNEVIIKYKGYRIILFEDLNPEARTHISIISETTGKTEEIIANTDARWTKLPISDLKEVSVKSRRVEEQTHITDADEFNLSPIKYMIFAKMEKEEIAAVNPNSVLVKAEDLVRYVGLTPNQAEVIIESRSEAIKQDKGIFTKDDIKNIVSDIT